LAACPLHACARVHCVHTREWTTCMHARPVSSILEYSHCLSGQLKYLGPKRQKLYGLDFGSLYSWAIAEKCQRMSSRYMAGKNPSSKWMKRCKTFFCILFWTPFRSFSLNLVFSLNLLTVEPPVGHAL
jgi:hypothetical protein